MTKVGWHVAGAAALFAWMFAAACVGDDPDATTSVDGGPPAGEFQGRCNEGRCLAGLECVDGVCIHERDANGATNDAAPSDAGIDAPSTFECQMGPQDAAPTENPCPTNAQSSASSSGAGSSSSSSGGQETCPANARVCCTAGDNMCVTSAAECVGTYAKPIACSGGETCSGGSICCLEVAEAGTVPDASTCPYAIRRVEIKGAACEAVPTCGTNKFRLCRTNAECPPPTGCRQLELKVDDPSVPLGVCL